MAETTVPAPDDVLGAESIVDAARARTQAPDYEFAHVDALTQLANSLRAEGGFSPAGQQAVRGALVACLATQAQASQVREIHPEIADVAITKPIFITGMTRSGTTLMHNLLAQHPALHSPNLWELMAPVTEKRDQETKDQLIAAARAFTTEYYRVAPKLPAVHYWDAMRPDECHRLTAPTFKTMAYELRYNVPSYSRWLAEQDQYDAYDYHKYLLQHILWREPAETVVMKCPFHLWRPDALVRTYPDARIVYMHRSPSVTIPSTCSLTDIIRSSRADNIDRHAIGEHWVNQFEDAINKWPEALRTHLAQTPVLNVDYRDFVANPIKVVGQISDFVGVEMTGAAERAVGAYLDDNPKDKFGKHEYQAEDYGLTLAELDRRFADYRAEYSL